MKTRVGSIVMECHNGRNGCGTATYDERGRTVIAIIGGCVKTTCNGLIHICKSWILIRR